MPWATGPRIRPTAQRKLSTANAQNEYTSVSGATTPTYDANGNMTTDSAGLKYVYNAWNQVVAVKNSSGTTLETYEYDGLGRRIEVTNSSTSTTTNLYYSSDSQVLEEFAGRRIHETIRLEPSLRKCVDSA